MEEKKKVLFSFVGVRDPYSDSKIKRLWKKFQGQETTSEGSILTACRWLKPDIVYLFPSSKEEAAHTLNPTDHTEDKANEARKIIISKFGIKECFVMPLKTDDATNTTKLYTCLRNNMRKIFNSLTRNEEQDSISNKYELIFILTSGTQQMNESARTFLPSLPYKFNYYRCIDPFHAQGKDRVKPDDLKLADEMLLLKYIEANVKSYYFHSVIENCERLSDISIVKMRRDRAAEIKKIFTAYEFIDLVQYDKANETIASAANFYNKHKAEFLEKQPTLPVKKISDVLNRQVKFLEDLYVNVRTGNEAENVNNLIDLYYNMERAYVRGNYVDVLARFWRLREGIMNYRMLKCYCLDRRNLKKTFSNNEDEKLRQKNYERLLNSNYNSKVDWENNRVRYEINAMVSLLTEFFNDADFKKLEDRWSEQLKHLQESRNQTIVAHGMRPVSKNTADICINLAKELINLIPGGKEVYDNYPFKPEDMLEVLNLLIYI